MIQTHQDNGTDLAKLEALLQEDPVKHIYRHGLYSSLPQPITPFAAYHQVL